MNFFVTRLLKKISSQDSTSNIDTDEQSQIAENSEEAEKKVQDMNEQESFDKSKLLDSIKLGEIEETFDFVKEFGNSKINNAMQASASSSDTSGGIKMPAIFEHSTNEGDAEIQYETVLPELSTNESLILGFKTGLRDGINFDDDTKFDGVKFAVEINGKRVFEEVKMECKWDDYIVDLSEYVGHKINIKFITNCNGKGNSNYDWALWGMPRILLLKRNIESPEPNEPWVSFERGIFLGLLSTTEGIEDESAELKSVEFDFPKALPIPEIVELIGKDFEQESGKKLADVAIHTYRPELELVHLGTEKALVVTEEDFSINCVIRNNGRVPFTSDNRATVTLSGVKLKRDKSTKKVGRIKPNTESILTWRVSRFSIEKTVPVKANLIIPGGLAPTNDEPIETSIDANIIIESSLPKVTKSISDTLKTYEKYGYVAMENKHLRALFVRGEAGFCYCVLCSAQSGDYKEMAVYRPIAEFAYRDSKGEICKVYVQPSDHKLSGDNLGNSSVVFDFSKQDHDGATWNVSSRFSLEEDSQRLKAEYQLKVNQDRELVYFRGPMLYVGDSTFGENKDFGLFPGLEFLESDEPSSNERDAAYPINLRLVPHPYKITIPLMAIEKNGALISILWDAHQKWDGEHETLSAIFASPNFNDRQNNHLMGLFVPTPPDCVKENELSASNPYELKADSPVVLKAQIVLDGDADILDAIDHWTSAYGMASPLAPPRSDSEEIVLSRHAFMHSVWDEETQKSRHCVGWNPVCAPGFATLLRLDYLATSLRTQESLSTHDDKSVRDESVKERVELIAQKTIEEQGEEGLVSTAACHILKWEFPFYYGRLEPATEKIMEIAENLISSQERDGSWRFHPTSARSPRRVRTKELGKEGDAVLGTCAHKALTVLKCARIIGKESILQAGLKALRFMDRFDVPRGAQTWECPLYEPDILAAGYAVGAYVEAYNITGNSSYLEKAEYWAKAGLPFLYFWNLQDRKGMRFASIPVFGTTFYTHSWFGVPVQWNGLVYAYQLQHLAQAMENKRSAKLHKPSSYWKKIAKGITVSAMYQQWMDENLELKGTYPDSFYGYCTERKGPHINPENIMVNLYTLRGLDPDISTEILRTRDTRIHVSSGAKVSKLNRGRDGNLSFMLKYVPDQTAYILVAGYAKPDEIYVDDVKLLAESNQTRRLQVVENGWLYSEKHDMTFIKFVQKQEKVKLNLIPQKITEDSDSN